MDEAIDKDSNAEKKENIKTPPLDEFKICEVWIRSGQIMLDAAPNFWQDRCRALGVLMLCQDIVKTAKMPEEPKSKIIPANGGMMNFARNIFGKGKR